MEQFNYITSPITEAEKKQLDALSAAFETDEYDSDNEEELENFFTQLEQKSLARIFFLIKSNQYDSTRGESIIKFMLTSPTLATYWQETLKKNESLYFNLIPGNSQNSTIYTPIHHLISDYLFAAYYEYDDREQITPQHKVILDMCCNDLGCYKALSIRSISNTNKINNYLNDLENINKLIASLMQDCDKLSEFYGALGYAKAGKTLLNIATKLRSSQLADDQDIINRIATFSEQAVKCFAIAHFLENDIYSMTLTNLLTNKQGISSLFFNSQNYNSWDKASVELESLVGHDIYLQLLSEAKNEVSKMQPRGIEILSNEEDYILGLY